MDEAATRRRASFAIWGLPRCAFRGRRRAPSHRRCDIRRALSADWSGLSRPKVIIDHDLARYVGVSGIPRDVQAVSESL